MAAGKAVSTKHHQSMVATLKDVEDPLTKPLLDAQLGSVLDGQLLLLPDSPRAVELWRDQRMAMLAWLLASFVSMLLFTPLFRETRLFLLAVAAVTAACLGIVATNVHISEQDLAASSILELYGQIWTVVCCGHVACWLDAAAVLLTPLLLWQTTCDPECDECRVQAMVVTVFVLCCVQHGVVSWVVSAKASHIMLMLQPVSIESLSV
jgi:hypothetical protein